MPINAQTVHESAKRDSFISALNLVLAKVGREMLLNAYTYNPSVAEGSVGYNAFDKRTKLATKLNNTPELYADAFARQLVLVDEAYALETDIDTLENYCADQTVYDSVAGVNINDITL